MSEKFRIKKQRILSALSRAGDDYTDASPKGSIDEGVRDLIALINDTQNFMTTSSCAGRIAVYLDGPSRLAVSRAPRENQDGPISVPLKNDPSLSTGGKGGGRWLFTSHSPVNFGILASSGQLFREFGFSSQSEVSCPSAEASPQFVHFKFEPMVSAKLLKNLSFSTDRSMLHRYYILWRPRQKTLKLHSKQPYKQDSERAEPVVSSTAKAVHQLRWLQSAAQA